jgi:hypothetical protein
MAQYRTAQGKKVDMSALVARNERTRAVGNMKVNARGDTIDARGRIIETATDRAAKHYTNTVGNKAARQVTPRPTPQNVQPPVAPPEEPMIDEFASPEDDEIVQIKKEIESKKGKK